MRLKWISCHIHDENIYKTHTLTPHFGVQYYEIHTHTYFLVKRQYIRVVCVISSKFYILWISLCVEPYTFSNVQHAVRGICKLCRARQRRMWDEWLTKLNGWRITWYLRNVQLIFFFGCKFVWWVIENSTFYIYVYITKTHVKEYIILI